jgi:lipoprotein NlpD
MRKLMPNSTSTSILNGVMTSLILLTLTACASKPTINYSNTRNLVVPQYYTVKAGDTLSKIAMRYNLDYRQIAAINNIDSSYIIYTNQSLRLYDRNQNTPIAPVKSIATPTVESIRTQALPQSQPTIQSTPIQAPMIAATSTQPPITANPVPNVANSTPPVANIAATSPAPIQYSIAWKWPSSGQVVQQFDPSKDVKGIRITGNQGDSITAAADGEVVYASDRLTEYGNLILIRHFSNGYVTAYAHNSKMLVTENQRVKAGQKIAEMGSSGAKQVMLEFQVRLNGKPINPLSLLPQR